jgi:hypothetical protein
MLKRTPVLNHFADSTLSTCRAFSATENIESQWALAGHKLTGLSMQQIVDCSWWDDGCGGGFPSYAYDVRFTHRHTHTHTRGTTNPVAGGYVQYVIDAPGLDALANYPYTAVGGSCAFKESQVVAKISSWTYTTTDSNEHQMANYLAQHGPISVCVDAESWPSYTGTNQLHSRACVSCVVCVPGSQCFCFVLQAVCTGRRRAAPRLTTACLRSATT